jgi:glycosyltransferase involved in cell wall biosynthesis
MVSVLIPTIASRRGFLQRAVASAWGQTLPPDAVEVELDTDRDGAAATRNRALARVGTEWVAFLDDDDVLRPTHLEDCLHHAQRHDADVVYPGYDVVGGVDLVRRFGMPFDADLLRQANYIPVTAVCRTELVRAVGGFRPYRKPFPCEDWGLWLALLDAGARFSHLPERTWVWTRHLGNTWGRGVNHDAPPHPGGADPCPAER